MQVLKNILTFALTASQTTVVAHSMNINGIGMTPRLVQMDGGGFGVTADSASITVSRGANAQSTVKAYLELWHSFEDCEPLPNGIATSLYPVVVQGGGSQGDAGIGIAAGSQTATNGTVVLSLSNGVSYGMSGSTQITGRVASVIGTGNENLAITASGSGNIVVAATSGSLNATARNVIVSAGTNGGISIVANNTSDSEGILMSANNLSLNATSLARISAGSVVVSGASQAQLLGSTVVIQGISNGSLAMFGAAGQSRVAITGASSAATAAGLNAIVGQLVSVLGSLGIVSNGLT